MRYLEGSMERQVSVMRTTSRLAGYWVGTGVLLALVTAMMVGCSSGTIDDDDGYDPGLIDFPQYRNLTIILRVIDQDGDPVGGASVWVDGEEAIETSEDELRPLGTGFPREWRGWLANWVSDDYRVVINYPGDTDEFDIEVGKTGYWSDETSVVISDWEPDEIFIRDVMVLERQYGWVASASAREPHQAEVTGADAGFSREPGSEPRITIGDE